MRRTRLFTGVFLSGLLASCAEPGGPRLAGPTVLTPDSALPVAHLDGTDVAISPDGRHVVYVASLEGTSQLVVQDLEGGLAVPIPDTQGVEGDPFFSPDSRWLAFFSSGRLMKIALDGGQPTILCDARAPRGGSWGPDDTIVFSATAGRVTTGEGSLPVEIYRTTAMGGAADPIAVPDPGKGEREYRWPQLLPGGEHVLFTIFGRGGFQIAVLSLETGRRQIVVREGRNARYSPTGHLIYGLEGTLLAAPFDLGTLRVTGNSVSILERVRQFENSAIDYDFSSSDHLIYVPAVATGSDVPARLLVRVDAEGSVEPLPFEPEVYRYPRISPDGRQLVATVGVPVRNPQIWLFDLTGDSGPVQLTYNGSNTTPIWTSDGERITFGSNRRGQLNLFWRVKDSRILDPPQWLAVGDYPQRPLSWSPDDRTLVFSETHPLTGLDLWILDLSRAARPEPLRQTRFNEFDAAISPDGRSMAFVSDPAMRDEVFVLPYPPGESDQPRQVSTQGGLGPAWSRDGKRLFYFENDGLMEVRITRGGRDPAWQAPRVLFTGDFLQIRPRSYDVAPDGTFVMVQESHESEEPAQIHILSDWAEGL